MRVIYIDLDRTTFRTDKANELFAVIERLYPDNNKIRDGYTKRNEYYVFAHANNGDNTTYYHDIVRQLHDAGLDAREVFRRLHEELADGRFEYPYLNECITTLKAYGTVKVLTYGEDVYQRFKASLCPSLGGTEVVTLIGSKSEYLATNAQAGDWIIDDKRLDTIPEGIRAIHIQHDEHMAADVHSLREATEQIVTRIDI